MCVCMSVCVCVCMCVCVCGVSGWEVGVGQNKVPENKREIVLSNASRAQRKNNGVFSLVNSFAPFYM